MATEHQPMKPGRKSFEAMLASFLARELAEPMGDDAMAATEVQPHLSSGFRVPDARLAFREGIFVATALLNSDDAEAFGDTWLKHVPEWSMIVRQQQPMLALPLAIGNFPQLVQDLAPLFQGSKGLQGSPAVGRPMEAGELAGWGQQQLEKSAWAQATFATAALRLAGREEEATALLHSLQAKAPKAWQNLHLNEAAAMAWHFGRRDEAAKLWQQHPAKTSVAIRFNLGLAKVCQGQTADAQLLFKQAASELPEKSAWHALAQLYRTLATMG